MDKKRRIVHNYTNWLIDKCGFCGLWSNWASDGRGNLFCVKCGH